MSTVTVYCQGKRVKIPVQQRQLLRYEHYGQGTFRWLCRLTARRPISMAAIADKLGITLQAVSMFYCGYVKPYIPRRLRVKTVAKPSKPKRLSLPTNLVTLAKRAARHGLAARPIATKYGGACRRTIGINVWVCRALSCRPNHPGGYAGFLLTGSKVEDHDFFIITLRQVDKPSVYYVVPVEALKRLLSGRTMLIVYIPTRSHKIRRPRVLDWDQFRSAWHLLKKRR